MFEFIFGIAVVIASGLIAFKADRWSGNGKKLYGMLGLGLAIALPVWTGLAFEWGLLSQNQFVAAGLMAGSYALSVVAGLCLRRWFLWGATFMNNEKGPKEEGHKYIYKIGEQITKFKWNDADSERLVILKMTMWMTHHAIAGFLAAALIALSNLTVVPFVMVILAGLLRAYIYRLEYLQDSSTQIDEAEPDAGLFTYALMALSRM